MMGIHYLKMRIGLDLRPFLREETGIGVYFRHLLFSMAKIDRTDEFFLFSSSLKDRFDPEKIPPFAKKKFVDLRYPVKAINFFWSRFQWPSLDVFFKSPLDLTHSPTPVPLPTGGKKIITVHDLFFLDFPEQTGKGDGYVFAKGMQETLRQVDGIVAVSRYTAGQLLERFDLDKNKIRVIHHGISLEEWGECEPESLGRTKISFALPDEFLLFVGALESRKNLPLLIKALPVLHDRHGKIPLVVVGRRGSDSDTVEKIVRERGLDPWVKMVGYVNQADLRNIYRLASVFVYPSLVEGFGIPLLEAMASSLPVVASRSSALPEIAQDAALYIDPQDPVDLAAKIYQIMKDPSVREKLVSAGINRVRDFTWEKAASETVTFYEDVCRRSEPCA
jgi:glycosyltransferase involved in cell wall biosynthesis